MTIASPHAVPFAHGTASGGLLVRVPDRLTVAGAVEFRRAFEAALAAAGTCRVVILDFGGTSLIDSSGIGSLVGCLKAARAAGLRLEAWSVCPQVQLALSLAGLEAVLPLRPGSEGILPSGSLRISQRPPVTHPSVRCRAKRLMDIAGALLGLAVTGVLFVPIAVAIRLDSRGPILFSQPRLGWMGRGFRIWKFRSMVSNAEALRATVRNEAEGAIFKNEADPRITRVGRVLRKTSLDELPQFWNVLVGDMSLIGTRPPTPDEVERYRIPNWQRFDVRPGLSGEWQVHGRSRIKNFEQVVELDLRYQENWSLLYDCKLILKTFAVIFSKNSGAA